jgi:hypothetical protein
MLPAGLGCVEVFPKRPPVVLVAPAAGVVVFCVLPLRRFAVSFFSGKIKMTPLWRAGRRDWSLEEME